MTGDVPALLFSKDYHSAWLNSAALARADGDLEVEGGVVERDAAGEPTGVLREESAWQFRARFAMPSEDEFVDATREGLRIAASRGVVAIHDKDGWLGAPGIFQRIHEREGLTLRVWGSVPYERLPELDALGIHSGHRRRLPADRLPEGVHGRDARLADRVDARRLRRRHHERRAARRGHHGGRTARLAGRRARDRRPRQPRGARRLRADARRVGAARTAPPRSSTRSASRPRTSAGSRSSASPARCSSATRRRIATSPSASGPSRSAAPTRSARCWSPARSSRTARTLRWRSSTRSPGSEPASCARSTSGPLGIPEQCLTVEEALVATCVSPAWLSRDERRRGKLLPGYLADLVVLSRDPLECPPDELESVEVVATMVGGRWVHDRAALGLMSPDGHRSQEGRRVLRLGPGDVRPRPSGPCRARVRDPRRALRAPAGHAACSRSARAPARRPGVSSSSAPTRSSRSSRTRTSRATSRAPSGTRVDIRVTALEDAELRESSFDLAAAASSFHWIDEDVGLATVCRRAAAGRLGRALVDRLRRPDAAGPVSERRRPSCSTTCRRAPSAAAAAAGRRRRKEERAWLSSLDAAGFVDVVARADPAGARPSTRTGIRAIFSTFSPFLVVDAERRTKTPRRVRADRARPNSTIGWRSRS